VGDWSRRRDLIYFEKRSNRVIELIPLNSNPATNPNSSHSTNNNTSTQSTLQCTANDYMLGRKKSLASRMLRLFGPCARCNDPNQSFDATNATYTVVIPLLGNESNRD